MLRFPPLPQELGAEVAELLAGSSVFIVGMMGCGKSSLSKKLGEYLTYMVLDRQVCRRPSSAFCSLPPSCRAPRGACCPLPAPLRRPLRVCGLLPPAR